MVILSSSCYTSHCDGYTGHRRDSYTGHWDVILVICYVICNHYRSVLLVVQSEWIQSLLLVVMETVQPVTASWDRSGRVNGIFRSFTMVSPVTSVSDGVIDRERLLAMINVCSVLRSRRCSSRCRTSSRPCRTRSSGGISLTERAPITPLCCCHTTRYEPHVDVTPPDITPMLMLHHLTSPPCWCYATRYHPHVEAGWLIEFWSWFRF